MQDQDKQYNANMDDDFGLPEVKYSPIERENETPPAFEQPTYYTKDEEYTSNKRWIITAVISFFVLISLVVYLFLFNGLDQISALFADQPQQPVVMEVPKEEEEVPVQEPEVVEAPEQEPEVVTEVNPLAPYEGITTISEPTGLSYIVIASFVDGDLANDFGQKMLNNGVGVKIIEPTNRSPIQYRVAVAEYNTFQEAMQEINAFRNSYGDKTWVLKF